LNAAQPVAFLGEEEMALNKKKKSKATRMSEEHPTQPIKPIETAPDEMRMPPESKQLAEKHPALSLKKIEPEEIKETPESIFSEVSVQEKISLLAYRYWEERGRPGGSPDEDWFRAERDVLGQMNFAE
jgi:hypothetical protein